MQLLVAWAFSRVAYGVFAESEIKMAPNPRAIQIRMRLIGVMLFPIALYSFVCLLTYSANDYPNSSLRPDQTFNLGGQAGAQFAYALVTFFGYCAYGVPITIALLAWNRFTNRSLGSFLVIPGIGLCFICSTAMTVSLVAAIPEARRFAFGGGAGAWLAQNLAGVVGTQAALWVSCVVLLGMPLFLLVWVARRHARRRALARLTDNLYGATPPPRSSLS